ncbi:MAG: hypothetical protein AAF004_06850 [Pseudomonadota bacterium]
MLKPIFILTVAGVLAAGAPTAAADDARYDHRGHAPSASVRHVYDYHFLTRAERRDLRRLQRFDRRDLTRAERRYLRRLTQRIALYNDRQRRAQRQLRRRDAARYYHYTRGPRC